MLTSPQSRGLWASIALVATGILAVRLLQLAYRRLRLTITVSLSREQHKYWARDSSTWSKIKKHLLQAPLGQSRHNREIQLSRAISVGTLPSRLHALVIMIYVVSNIVYCALLDYHGQSRAAMIAELRGRSGHLAVINMLVLVLFAARNNPLISILAVSFDTFNLLHRWIGRVIVLESVVHIVAWIVNNHNAIGYTGITEVLMTDPFAQCGLAATTALLIIMVQSPSAIRHAFYETFLHAHQMLAVVVLGATAAHIQIEKLPQRPIIYTVIGIWASERVLRLGRLGYYNLSRRGVTRAHVQALNGGACRVTFHIQRPFVESPGHHIYAYLPSVSHWMSHPFSVAWVNNSRTSSDVLHSAFPSTSSFEHPEMSLKHQTGNTPYSVSCIMAARTGMTKKLYDRAMSSPNGLYTCLALVEGPYGVSEPLDSYGTVLLFAGGAGITNQLSHMHHIIQGWAASTCATQKLVLVWSVRSLDQLEWARPWLQQLSQMERHGRDLEILVHVTQLPREDEATEAPEMDFRPGRADVDKLTKSSVHVTQLPSKDEVTVSPELHIRPGRANIDKLVRLNFHDRIGAMTIGVCGPGALADDVRKVARAVMDQGKVDFWEEAFTW